MTNVFINQMPMLHGSEYRFEIYNSSNISSDLITKVADYYRYLFNNNGHFLFFPKAFSFMSPQQFFGYGADVRVSLSEMDNLQSFPMHPVTQETAILWHRPETTRAAIAEKLSKESTLVLIRENVSASIVGFFLGYKTSIYEAFKMEGWESPFYYTGLKHELASRSFDDFLSKVKQTISQNPSEFGDNVRQHKDISSETEVFICSCIGKTAGNKEYLYVLMQLFFESIPQHFRENLLVFGEPRFQSNSYHMFRNAGYLDIPGVLAKETKELTIEDSILQICTLSKISDYFIRKTKAYFANLSRRSSTAGDESILFPSE